MDEQERMDENTMAPVSRRQLLAAFGMASAALAAQSILTGQGAAAAQNPTVSGSTYGGSGTVTGATYNSNVPGSGYPHHLLYETVAEMKADANLADGLLASTSGYYEPGDGGGADYVIRSGTLPEDGGGVISLSANGLQAVLLPGDSIRYKQFGAVGDGSNDDGVQLKKAHAYANERNLPLVNLSGEYWVKQTNEIIIQTNVSWGHTKFHIDESFNSMSSPRFRVTSRKSVVTIALDAAAKASFLSQMKPGTTLIPELAPYKNSLVFIVDSNDKIGVRYGYTHNGWNREEFFLCRGARSPDRGHRLDICGLHELGRLSVRRQLFGHRRRNVLYVGKQPGR